jgi:hypothetical protein
MLLHRLQQGRLRLGRRAVDLVGQDDVAEDRAGHEDQMAAAGVGILLDDVRPRDVGRHQVGRELDAGELEVQHLGQGVDDQGLGQAGHARDDAVAAHEERDQHLLDHVVLADDQLAQLAHDAVAALLHALGQGDVVRAGGSRGDRFCGHVAPSGSSRKSRSPRPACRPRC